MGARGPAPQPVKILRAKGQFRKDRHGGRLEGIDGEPARPVLSPEAEAEWDRILPLLERMGVMSPADRGSLAVYCEAWADYVRAAAFAAEVGYLPKAVSAKRAAGEAFIKVAVQFGLTPSARSRVQRVDDDKAKAKGKERFFAAG